jgi:uncharacterized protein (DUF488 family)
MLNLFLTGYENESIEKFLNKLKSNGITVIIDVREIPLSRKSGFSKFQLKNSLEKLGIQYYHFSKLGSPSEIRHKLKSGESDYLEFFKKFRNYIIHNNTDFDETISIISNNKKTSLLCFEEDTNLCHRTILASEILKREKNIKVIPL